MDFCNRHRPYTPEQVLPGKMSRVVMMISPLSLLILFIVFTAIHGVVLARKEEEIIVPAARGPGGKLLPITKRKKKTGGETAPSFTKLARRFFQYASAVICLSYFANGCAIAIHASWDRRGTRDMQRGWWAGTDPVVYTIGSSFLYLYFFITLVDWKTSPTIVHFVTFSFSYIFEVIILVALILRCTGPHCVRERDEFVVYKQPTFWDLFDISISSIRVVLLMGMVLLYGYVKIPYFIRKYRRRWRANTGETTPLLTEANSPVEYNSISENGHCNGSVNGRANGSAALDRAKGSEQNGHANGGTEATSLVKDAEAAFYRPEKLPHKSWYEYIRGYTLFFPYLWPRSNVGLQFLVLLCFLVMVAQRLVNVMVPLQLGLVIDAFAYKDSMPFREITLFWLFKYLQGSSGLLGCIRGLLWIPVSQHSYRALTTASFEHVHALSLDFHLGKRTGEVLSALNKGASINSFMEQVTFQVFPMLFDLMFAIWYFYMYYNIIYAELVTIITFYYLFVTIRMAASRADQRRDMVNADREEEAVKNDSITSYETVKYFNAEGYEFDRYRNAIKEFQEYEAMYLYGMSVMNICQSLVFMCGLLVAMMLGAWEVAYGLREIGAFVTLITYLQQLQGPLNFFGTFYRTVQQAMISAERLLELFKVQPTVVDEQGVTPLDECRGHIRWDRVKFAYDPRKPALQEVSFECKPGTTTAFVGESGGGKSTIFRLMYRYYNCHDGKIEIDGQNVRNLTIDSVRKHIGVVPQDTILFNESLMYNLKYANQEAPDEEIFRACRAAHIHDRILAFPDGYETKVGERGLRLSGGEKQRVAIARTLLKNPKLILLDEATSALDSSTEQQIQKELHEVLSGRTLLIIAHRLSTVVHADQILVLHAGAVVEKGTHDQLLECGGKYKAMWEKQCKAEEAEKAANLKRAEAKKLLHQAGLSGNDSASERGSISDGDANNPQPPTTPNA
ncbi:uncharacterized protein MKZ38_003447 [Zalerion maritima]|uniref:Heavy metal tolerance protein n=1 Tax=Zalerion maritima TaxID=339359 RepID=A0AAD5RP57_9PEZI|nr:uncharacterized protein MKZ38_003447 [Zalerion maritima]